MNIVWKRPKLRFGGKFRTNVRAKTPSLPAKRPAFTSRTPFRCPLPSRGAGPFSRVSASGAADGSSAAPIATVARRRPPRAALQRHQVSTRPPSPPPLRRCAPGPSSGVAGRAPRPGPSPSRAESYLGGPPFRSRPSLEFFRVDGSFGRLTFGNRQPAAPPRATSPRGGALSRARVGGPVFPSRLGAVHFRLRRRDARVSHRRRRFTRRTLRLCVAPHPFPPLSRLRPRPLSGGARHRVAPPLYTRFGAFEPFSGELRAYARRPVDDDDTDPAHDAPPAHTVNCHRNSKSPRKFGRARETRFASILGVSDCPVWSDIIRVSIRAFDVNSFYSRRTIICNDSVH